jgi:hypothetical protein
VSPLPLPSRAPAAPPPGRGSAGFLALS